MEWALDTGTQDMIDKLTKMGERVPHDLHPPRINGMARDAVSIISSMSTQWEYAPMGMGGAIRVGLKYPSLDVVAKINKIKISKPLFSIIRQIESIILEKQGDNNGS